MNVVQCKITTFLRHASIWNIPSRCTHKCHLYSCIQDGIQIVLGLTVQIGYIHLPTPRFLKLQIRKLCYIIQRPTSKRFDHTFKATYYKAMHFNYFVYQRHIQ